MKIINEILVYIISYFLINFRACNQIPNPNFSHNNSLKKDEPILIKNPQGTVLYQFALGAADILVSDKSAASECQVQHWMIDQPSIQQGSAQWFEQLAEPLIEMKSLIDIYALQPVCQKYRFRLQQWLLVSLDKEYKRYIHNKRLNVTHENIEEYQDPYDPRLNPNKRRIFLSKSKKTLKSQITRKTELSKTKTKDWWKVLSLSLPKLPYHILQYKIVLDKLLRGFLMIHFNEFIDCVAASIDTGRAINDRILVYRSLMTYSKNGKSLHEFENVFEICLCNWNRFLDFVNTLDKGNKEKDWKRKYFLYGQALAKLVVAISTGPLTKR